MRFKPLRALILLCGAAACADAAGTLLPNPDAEGISFRYSGAASGSHESSGTLAAGTDGLPAGGSWALARPDSLGGLVIAGFEATGPATGDLFILQLPDPEAGVHTCTLHGADGGCHGRLFLGVDLRDAAVTGGVYPVTSGTATIDELTDDWLRGAFDLTLAAPEGGEPLQVTDGAMDVEYATDVTLANGVACLARNLVEGRNERCL